MGKDKFMKTWMRRSTLRGLSIQQRLPLLICILLLSVMITFSWISYLGVKNSALRAGRERLNSLSTQLSTMFGQSTQALINSTRTTAAQDPLKQCLQSTEPTACTDALAVLEKVRQDSTSVLVELVNLNRIPVLQSSKTSAVNRASLDSILGVSVKLDSGTVGKIYNVRDSMYYPSIAAVTANNKTIGYLIRWRLITTNPKFVEQLSQLMGTKATLYIGNTDRSLWTNMIKIIPDPFPADAGNTLSAFDFSRSRGRKFIAAEKMVPHTPWMIAIEFSQQSVLESAHSFLRWIIIIGGILVAIGIFIAWIMSRNITLPLKELTAAVSVVARGQDAPAVPVYRRDEVGELARAFNAMGEQVRNAKLDLEQKIIETEQMNEQLRSLSAHLQNIREEERIHIAREMHDELGQLLTGFKMDVSWLNKRLNGKDDPVIKEKLSALLSMVDEAVSFVRRIASELRPSILDDLGLIAALEWQSKEFTKRFQIDVDFYSQSPEVHTSGLIATGLFRMYQESLTNVARHSQAQKVESMLEIKQDQICLSIRDNGKGFDMNIPTEKRTLGLLGMKERALMIGGHLEIQSEKGKGTTVLITIPLRAN